MQQQEENKFISGFVGSMLVHAALLILFMVIPTPKPPEAPMKFEVLELPARTKADQVIHSVDLPDSKITPESPEDRLRFLADKTQRVKEQLRALRNGLTKNRSPEIPTPPQKKQSPTGYEKFLPNRIALPTPKQMSEQERGFSTLSEDLPTDIRVGEITSVDTDHYLFYSYFSRAGEALWNEWDPMIQSILSRPPPSIKASTQSRYTTILEAWFFPSGQLHSVHIMKPSGIPEFDYAASASFKRVGMMPHPPREKIDPDGLARFKWSLSVEYDPKVLVRQ